MQNTIQTYRSELSSELDNILNYWEQNVIDEVDGGFYGKINGFNQLEKNAPKGGVLNCRILWTFSSAYNFTKQEKYHLTAKRAFDYILKFFKDEKNGGIYWLVDHEGKPLDTKKQIYAVAFAIYGLTEYYIACKDDKALQFAIELFNNIEYKSFDEDQNGYLEALTIDWNPIDDLRLSAKDANEKKTMNTHLHILEAYTNLYRIWKNELLKKKIENLINLFFNHIIDKNTNHLILFFDENWKVKSNIISYGHDIEASWLLLEAAEVLQSEELIEKIKNISIKIADAAAEGIDTDGGLWYEVEDNHLVKEKHWWVQAEAMIGFFNAYKITNNMEFLNKSIKNWDFVKANILDKEYGEWKWGVKDNYIIMKGEDKAGFWKCPYHNSRACIEILKRIDEHILID